jgi:hypothetical protein
MGYGKPEPPGAGVADAAARELFAAWQEELDARARVRQLAAEPGALAGLEPEEETADLLFRALFPSQRMALYRWLLQHSQSMPLLRWLGAAPESVLRDFLDTLPYLLRAGQERANLDFLVRLYRPALQDPYRRIAAALDRVQLESLAGRSGNPELRRLLRQRRDSLASEQKESNRGVEVESVRVPGWGNLFGERTDLMREALAALREVAALDRHDPGGAARQLALVQAAEQVFMVGWPEDSLALLVQAYGDFLRRSRLGDGAEAAAVYRRLDQAVRTVLPLYCLVAFGTGARGAAEDIYRTHFPQLNLDRASLGFLGLYRAWVVGRETSFILPRAALVDFCAEAGRLRPGDPFVAVARAWSEGEVGPAGLQVCLEAGAERLARRPQESFVIAEFYTKAA